MIGSEKQLEKELNDLARVIKDLAYKVIEAIKKCFRGAAKWLKRVLNSIDYEKYIKYKKHQKRVKNRKILYAKRRAKYGR